MWAQGTWRAGTWIAGLWAGEDQPSSAAVLASRSDGSNFQSSARTNIYQFSRTPTASAVREDELPPSQRCAAASADRTTSTGTDRPVQTSASRTTAAPRSIRHNLSTGRRT